MTHKPLRLSADDPGVLARTRAALTASVDKKPLLRLKCAKCGNLLAEVGDIPNYGPLFVSSWPVETNEHRVVVNDRELNGRERRRWFAENYETVEASGEAIDAPLREAVIALLALPEAVAQDYPALLTRCDKEHGHFVADRFKTISLLRQAVSAGKPIDHRVTMTPGDVDYLPSRLNPGPSSSHRRSVTRRLRTQTMTVAEYEARTRDTHRE